MKATNTSIGIIRTKISTHHDKYKYLNPDNQTDVREYRLHNCSDLTVIFYLLSVTFMLPFLNNVIIKYSNLNK